MASRFNKPDNNSEIPQPDKCVCNGCWLFPSQSVSNGGIRLYCDFHNQGMQGAERDRITHMLNRNETLVKHYYQHLRNKTPVEIDMDEKAGKHYGVMGDGDMAIWNRRDDENGQQYKSRYWQQIVHMIHTGTGSLPEETEAA